MALIVMGIGCGGDDVPGEVADSQSSGATSSTSTGSPGGSSSGGEGTANDTTGSAPVGCDAGAPVPPQSGFFTDVSEASGIQVGNFLENPPRGTAINDHSRLAFADIDGDGFDDIVMH